MQWILSFLSFLVFPLLLEAQKQLPKTENLGPKINSRYSEIGPFISPDGSEFFFTRGGHPENKGYAENPSAQDVWYSYRIGDSAWAEAIRLEAPFNLRTYNSAEHLSSDGNTLYIRGYFTGDTYHRFGFRVLQRYGYNWIVTDTIEIPGIENQFQGSTFGMSLSADNQTMFLYYATNAFTEQMDLWISFKNPDASWTAPKRLPKPINSAADEITAFLAADNRTLYFSSARKGGWGSNDI